MIINAILAPIGLIRSEMSFNHRTAFGIYPVTVNHDLHKFQLQDLNHP